jgi:hypothetical protein
MAIAILVPVLGRPQRAQPLVDSIRASTTLPYTLLFLCSRTDDALEAYAALSETHVCPFDPGPGDFARKMNLGFRLTGGDFCFLGATDLTFTAGWDVEALRVAEETGAGVIGTQDRANPVVKKGRHSTHPLVRRAYIERCGGTVDGSGQIYCELYDHQCVDNELIETAQHRGEWAFAPNSVVIHHHPFYDRQAKMDATYEKALAKGKEDIRLFQRRRRLWVRERQLARRLSR